jgi:predicted nucleotidyltransferase
MNAILKINREKIEAICQKRQVKKLYSFGSINTVTFNDQSDVDLLVDFKEMNLEDYADNYFEMCYDLENLLNREVDLVSMRSLGNPVFKKKLNQPNNYYLIRQEVHTCIKRRSKTTLTRPIKLVPPYLLTSKASPFFPTPLIFNDFHAFGKRVCRCSTPSSVISNPPKPLITACSMPPAPVAK